MKTKGQDMPIVIVGNKSDKDIREMERVEVEALVQMDWENGYVECSARLNQNISTVFKELLNQARSELCPVRYHTSEDGLLTVAADSINMRRRQSLPIVPVFNKGESLLSGAGKKRESRRGSMTPAALGRQSCKIS